MNKMATAMQEGEYDSEKPQNKVMQWQELWVLTLTWLSWCRIFKFWRRHLSEPSTCGRASGGSPSWNHRCWGSRAEAGGQRDRHQRAEEVSQDQGRYTHLPAETTNKKTQDCWVIVCLCHPKRKIRQVDLPAKAQVKYCLKKEKLIFLLLQMKSPNS